MPLASLKPTAEPHAARPVATGLRGWRLAVWVLAVLAVHVWLLNKWLATHPDTPTPAAAQAPAQPPANAVTMQVTPHDAPTATQSTDAKAHASKRQTATHPAQLPLETPPPDAARAGSSDDKNLNKNTHSSQSIKQLNAIDFEKQTQPPAAEAGPSAPPPGARSALNSATGTGAAESLAPSTPASQRDEPSAPSLTASIPGKLRLPGNATLSYDVKATRKGVSLPASSTLRFTQDGSTYDARLEIKALLVGSRTQTSKGLLDPAAGLQPLRFGDKAKSEQAAHFDRSRQPPVLRFSANTPDAPLQTHTQDRLSVLFQLAAMLAGEPKRFGAGSTVVVHTAGPRDADMWQFKVGKAEELALPAGTLTAIHLVRTPMHAYDNQVEVWLAPSLDHLPVRVLWTQANGDTVDQRLSSHEP